MTEADWLAGTDPDPMLRFLLGKPDPTGKGWFGWLRRKDRPQPDPEPFRASDRKLRLLGCACCRRIWPLLRDQRSRKAVEVSERYADGRAELEELQAAQKAALDALETLPDLPLEGPLSAMIVGQKVSTRNWSWAARAALEAARAETAAAVTAVVRAALETASAGGDFGWAASAAGAAARARLLREIFGNPFRLPELRPEWLTWQNATVPKLAQAVYEERAFERLPILADALEEAGCTDAALLAHCRDETEHVAGCWAVDRLLGQG